MDKAVVSIAAMSWKNLSSLSGLCIWLAVLAALVAVAVYVIGKVRRSVLQQEPTAQEMLTKFSEMHERGVLSEEEFREIKTALAPRITDELKDNGETG